MSEAAGFYISSQVGFSSLKGTFHVKYMEKFRGSLGIPQKAKIYLARDNSQGKYGYALTDHGIYSRVKWKPAFHLTWEKFRKAELRKESLRSYLSLKVLGRNGTFQGRILHKSTKEEEDRVSRLLFDLQEYLIQEDMLPKKRVFCDNPRFCLSDNHIFGRPWHYYLNDDVRVCLADVQIQAYKTIVDRRGNIQDFPGIVKEDFWVKKIGEGSLEPVIHFTADFLLLKNENYRMIWEIQPDGSYWGDDPRCMYPNQPKIQLYADMDRRGRFLGPFRLYQLGNQKYVGDNE